MSEIESLTTRVLRRAAEIVARGWCKGNMTDHRGNHCLLGAIRRATSEVLAVPVDSITFVGVPTIDCWEWNDAWGRKQSEVVDALLRASGWTGPVPKHFAKRTSESNSHIQRKDNG